MRQREHLGIDDVHLVVLDVDIARARPIADFPHAPEPILDGMQVIKELTRRNAAAHEHDGVDELFLVLVIRRLAPIEARNIDDLGIGNGAKLRNGVVELGDLPLLLFAFVRDQGNVASQPQHHERAQPLERLRRCGNVMRADDGRPELAGEQRLGGRSLVPVGCLRDVVCPADEALARNGAHERITEACELVEVPHELERLRRGFAKTGTRVDADALPRYAARFKLGCPVAQVIAHFGHDVVVHGVVLHGLGLALHVHDHQPGIARARHVDHGRIPEARNVVDDGRAGLYARTGHPRMPRVDAHAHALRRKRPHDLDRARQLFIDRYLRAAGTRGLAAHVDDVGTFVEHRMRMRESFRKTGMLSPIRKRIGCHVEDAHDHGLPLVKLKRRTTPHWSCTFQTTVRPPHGGPHPIYTKPRPAVHLRNAPPDGAKFRACVSLPQRMA